MRIHLTLAFLDGLHGSVLHVREYAAHLMSQGHEVSVSCLYADTETPELFRDSGIPVARVMDVDVSAPYDVLYALHFLSAGALLQQGLETRKLVLASLSGYARLESYPVFWREASLLTVVSEEVRLSHRRKFGVPMDKMLVAENAIPAGFDEAAPPRAEGYPRRVAVVSNHIPQELTEALALLPPEIQTDCIGREVGNSRLVTPELLRDYDLIITIGKTVQYAMGMGIPVFEYDRYGGNGYIRRSGHTQKQVYPFPWRPKQPTISPAGRTNVR